MKHLVSLHSDVGSDKCRSREIEGLENCDKAICSVCDVKNVGQKDILLHKISTHHVKKWRSGIRLQSQCMACSVTLSDIKSADTHVQGSGHEHQMRCNFKQGPFIDRIYKCPPCGLAFHCSVALELHLVMTHKVTFSSENLPDVVNVVQLLSGSSADASKTNIDLKCFVCQMNYEAMDDFIVHLFSNTHVQSLRVSACIACEKKFIHVKDREEHLRASKHRVRVQKSCLSNKLRKVKDNGQLECAGYLCMYCMVWCKSWPCLMVHLLDSSHSFYAARQDQQQMNRIQHNILKASNREAIEDIPCPSTSGRNWRRWLDQPVGLSAWCNVCEEIFPSPEATEKHLEDHHDLQIMHAKKKSNSSNCLTCTGQKSDRFECEVCCVIFKNPLALTVHKAFPQHHMQHHRISSGRNSCYCFDCRRQRRSAAFEKSVVPKSKPANVGDLQLNMANIENHLTKSWKSDTKQETADKCFNMDEFEVTRKNEHSLLDSIIKEKGTPFEVVEKGEMDSKNLGAVGVRDSSLPVIEPLEPGGNVGRDAKPGTSEQHLRESTVECQKKDGRDCHELINSDIPVGSTEMIPLVIAAALPSSEAIQSSLQSAMKLVTESLFVAIPKIRKPSTEVCTSKKRPRSEMYNSPANNNEDTNLGAILEAAVFEGLQSLNSCSSQSKAPVATGRQQGDVKRDQNPSTSTYGMQNSLGVPSASISIKTEHGIPVVLAATFLPEASSTEAPSPPCPRTETQMPLSTELHNNSHEMAMDKTCDDKVQNIDGSRRESLEADVLQEQDKANPTGNQSGEDTTQPLVVYEEDSTSDDDDNEWGYVSPDNSESSEDEY